MPCLFTLSQWMKLHFACESAFNSWCMARKQFPHGSSIVFAQAWAVKSRCLINIQLEKSADHHPRLNPRFPKSDTAILDTLPLWHSAMLTHCHAMSSCFLLWSSLRRSVTWNGIAEPTSKDSFLVKSSDLVCWETPCACRTPVSVFNPWDAQWGKTSYQSENCDKCNVSSGQGNISRPCPVIWHQNFLISTHSLKLLWLLCFVLGASLWVKPSVHVACAWLKRALIVTNERWTWTQIPWLWLWPLNFINKQVTIGDNLPMGWRGNNGNNQSSANFLSHQ